MDKRECQAVRLYDNDADLETNGSLTMPTRSVFQRPAQWGEDTNQIRTALWGDVDITWAGWIESISFAALVRVFMYIAPTLTINVDTTPAIRVACDATPTVNVEIA